MANDTPKLSVDLEARVTAFEKQLQKAQRAANDNFGKVEQRGKRMARTLDSDIGGAAQRTSGLLKNFGAGFLGGIAAGGAAGIVSQISQVAKGIASIGDEARRAGLSTKAFQELKYVAEQNRIGVDSLVDGFKELSLRADEFITTGAGSSAEAFQRLGYDAATLKEKLKDPSALFSEIIGKLGQLDKAAQIRIADEVFGGTGGEKFVQLIEQGETGIRDTIKAANDLGLVLDEELIRRADELDRKFSAITTTVGTGLKRAIVEAATALGGFVDRFKEIDAREIGTLTNQLAEAERNLAAAQSRKGGLGGLFDGPIDKQIANSQAEVARLRAAIATRQANAPIVPQLTITSGDAPTTPAGAAGKLTNTFDRLNGAVDRYVNNVVKAESGGNVNAKNPLSSATGLGQFIESTWLDLFKKNFPDRAQGMADATILALRSDAEISRSLIEAYATENASLLRQAGVSVNEAALHLAHFLGPQGAVAVLTAKAGTPVSQVLGASAISASPSILGGGATVDSVIAYSQKRAAALGAEKTAVDGLADSWAGLRDTTVSTTDTLNQQSAAYEQLAQVGQTALRGLSSALADGKLEGRELLQILLQVAQQLLAMPAVGGGGGAGGFLSTLLGGLGGMFREKGGPVRKGQPYIVGEKRPELFVPNQSGTIVPKVPTLNGPSVGGRQSAPQSMNITVKVDGARGDDHIVQLVQRGVAVGIQQARPGIVRDSVGAVQTNAKNRPGYLR